MTAAVVPAAVLASVRSIPDRLPSPRTPPEEGHMTMPLTDAEAATVARFDAAPDAPEALRERVAQAIYEAADGYMAGVPWERAKTNPFREAKAFRQADAALAVITTEATR